MTRARHWATLLLTASLVLALAACGGSADGARPPPESPPPPAATPAPAVTPDEAPATGTPAPPP
ncbi:MAG: YncE family protein, partial [Chloroflexi bacterium]|nr:YncE family protein [Chloroflexota bacterium]